MTDLELIWKSLEVDGPAVEVNIMALCDCARENNLDELADTVDWCLRHRIWPTSLSGLCYRFESDGRVMVDKQKRTWSNRLPGAIVSEFYRTNTKLINVSLRGLIGNLTKILKRGRQIWN
jgi:hypothetical protein